MPPSSPTIALIAALLAGPVLAGVELAYDSFEIDTGEAVSETLLHGKLTAPGQRHEHETDDLVVFGQSEDNQRSLAVYSLEDGEWRLGHATEVDASTIFVDMAELGGQDRLLTFRRGRIEWLDPKTWQTRPLVSASSFYNVPPLDVPHVDIGQDVNDDGLDDIALPDFDGYWIWSQRPDGRLSEPVKLPTEPTTHMAFRSATYRSRALYRLDFDGDGRQDLAFWNRDRFVLYLGTDGGYDTTPVAFDAPATFKSDDISVSYGFGSDEPNVMLHGIDDYNGDGIGDLATITMGARGLFSQTTRYDFHFGVRHDGTTTFNAEPDTSIAFDGIAGPMMAPADFDGDGRIDFGIAVAEIGIGKIIAALLTGSFSFAVEFYLMSDAGYPPEPNATKRVKVRISLTSGELLSANWLALADVTGDGIKDMLVANKSGLIDVYAGTGEADLFAREPLALRIDLPDDAMMPPGGIHVADLNDDGREDLIVELLSPSEKSPKTNRRIVALSR